MATTFETEAEDLQVVQKREPSAKSGGEEPASASGVSSRRFSRWILLLCAAIAVSGASLWWVHSQNYESTDDAQIEGHLDLVSSRISGTVLSINPKVENNRFVEAGTLLMELDPRDYAAELEHAKANLVTKVAEAHSANSIPRRLPKRKHWRASNPSRRTWLRHSTNCSRTKPSTLAPNGTGSAIRRS